MHATITYVMGSFDHPEQYRVDIFQHDERVLSARVLTADHDSTPAYDGALEAAYQIAEAIVGDEDGRILER